MPDFPQDAIPGQLYYPAEGSARNPLLYTFDGREWRQVDARTALIYWLRREKQRDLTLEEYDQLAELGAEALDKLRET